MVVVVVPYHLVEGRRERRRSLIDSSQNKLKLKALENPPYGKHFSLPRVTPHLAVNGEYHYKVCDSLACISLVSQLLYPSIHFNSVFVVRRPDTATMAEKDLVTNATTYDRRRPSYIDPVTGIENKEGRITEAAGLYGDIETAEEYGYVTRG